MRSNAVAESFFGTLKTELVDHEDYLSKRQAIRKLSVQGEALNPEGLEEALLILLLFTWQGHNRAIAIYGQTMDVLLDKAAKGDDQSLYKAISVDAAVLADAYVQVRIAQAALVGDQKFLDSLTKAIKQTKPRRPKKEYDSLRSMIDMLEEINALDGLSEDDLYDIFVTELSIYSDKGKDPTEGLKKLIQEQRNQK